MTLRMDEWVSGIEGPWGPLSPLVDGCGRDTLSTTRT